MDKHSVLQHERYGPVIAPGTNFRFATENDIGKVCWFSNINHIRSHSSPESGDYIKMTLCRISDEDDFGLIDYFGDERSFGFRYCFIKMENQHG